MSKDITEKQRKVLEYIKNEIRTNGYPPSVREICAGIGVSSTSTVQGYLDRLEKFGYIRRENTKNRTIKIVETEDVNNVIDFQDIKREMVNVPIVGRVTAGSPILATENIEDYMPLPVSNLKGGNYFMLRIVGDSMINAGILPDDLVLIRQQSDSRNGDIVVALLDDSATVKTYYKEKDFIRLQPENPTYMPIYSKDVKILGIVKGVFRFI